MILQVALFKQGFNFFHRPIFASAQAIQSSGTLLLAIVGIKGKVALNGKILESTE